MTFGETLKFTNFDWNKLKVSIHVYVSEKIMKMENSHFDIFDEIWPKSMHYSTGYLAQFLSSFKNS